MWNCALHISHVLLSCLTVSLASPMTNILISIYSLVNTHLYFSTAVLLQADGVDVTIKDHEDNDVVDLIKSNSMLEQFEAPLIEKLLARMTNKGKGKDKDKDKGEKSKKGIRKVLKKDKDKDSSKQGQGESLNSDSLDSHSHVSHMSHNDSVASIASIASASAARSISSSVVEAKKSLSSSSFDKVRGNGVLRGSITLTGAGGGSGGSGSGKHVNDNTMSQETRDASSNSNSNSNYNSKANMANGNDLSGPIVDHFPSPPFNNNLAGPGAIKDKNIKSRGRQDNSNSNSNSNEQNNDEGTEGYDEFAAFQVKSNVDDSDNDNNNDNHNDDGTHEQQQRQQQQGQYREIERERESPSFNTSDVHSAISLISDMTTDSLRTDVLLDKYART